MQADPTPFPDTDLSDGGASVRLRQGALGRLSSRFQGGHRVRLLSGGDQLFPAMEQALAAARTEVWLATYIFCDDPAGRRMADALVATAARGVQVSVVVDGFGSNGRIAVLRHCRRWQDLPSFPEYQSTGFFGLCSPRRRQWRHLHAGGRPSLLR